MEEEVVELAGAVTVPPAKQAAFGDPLRYLDASNIHTNPRRD